MMSDRADDDVWRPLIDANSPEKQHAASKQVAPTPISGVQSRPTVEATPSPYDSCPPTSQSTTSGQRLNNHARLDYCNSPRQTPIAMSRSWFDIDTSEVQPTSPLSTSFGGLRGGTMTESKIVCNICSSEALIPDVESGHWQGGTREAGCRGGFGGGSLPRNYGQRRAGDLAAPGSTASIPRGMSLLTTAILPASTASSSSSSCDHRGVMMTAAAAGGASVTLTSCPSPKRSASSRDDDCKQRFSGMLVFVLVLFGGLSLTYASSMVSCG